MPFLQPEFNQAGVKTLCLIKLRLEKSMKESWYFERILAIVESYKLLQDWSK